VVLARRAVAVFEAVDDGVVVVVDTVTDDDAGDVLPVFVGADWVRSLPAANVSSLRNFGRGGTTGFGPIFVGFGFVGLCLASGITTAPSSAKDGGGVTGVSATSGRP